MKKLCTFLAIFFAATIVLTLTACSGERNESFGNGTTSDSGPVHLALVVGCHAGSPGVKEDALMSVIQPLCTQEGSTIEVIALDGNPYRVADSKVRILNLDEYTRDQKARFIRNNAQTITERIMRDAVPKTAEVNPLKALHLAARTVNAYGKDGAKKQIIIMDSGLSTVSPLDMSTTGLSIDADKTVTALQAQQAIPNLSGTTVTCCYFGDTTPDQPELTTQDKEALNRLWAAILDKSGAEYSFSTDVPASETHITGALPKVRLIAAGKTSNAIGLAEKEVVELTETDLGFEPDSTKLKDESKANAVLATLAFDIRENNLFVVVAGSTAAVQSAGYANCKAFSKQRAEKVAQLLIAQGVSPQQLQVIGLGFENHSRRTNDSNGSEAAMQKNRVVYLATEDSAFAKEILSVS